MHQVFEKIESDIVDLDSETFIQDNGILKSSPLRPFGENVKMINVQYDNEMGVWSPLKSTPLSSKILKRKRKYDSEFKNSEGDSDDDYVGFSNNFIQKNSSPTQLTYKKKFIIDNNSDTDRDEDHDPLFILKPSNFVTDLNFCNNSVETEEDEEDIFDQIKFTPIKSIYNNNSGYNSSIHFTANPRYKSCITPTNNCNYIALNSSKSTPPNDNNYSSVNTTKITPPNAKHTLIYEKIYSKGISPLNRYVRTKNFNG
ncbi:hypothetical protein HDU92_008301 [Lobulomyces angularis]|nr:hypothetical protein HDU92_008301 [Lobulomyces angularis]